ncbi:MAG: M48 family metallopeptidase [Desulfobacter sp.]|nr:MAG: M48 family metallopeptidase [Desulfobacter sp.]
MYQWYPQSSPASIYRARLEGPLNHQTTILVYPSAVKFRRLTKRWGSCTRDNEIILNYDAVKLPFTLIDYIVVHELVHIKHKDHSKAFYQELAKYMPDWELLEEKLCGMKL